VNAERAHARVLAQEGGHLGQPRPGPGRVRSGRQRGPDQRDAAHVGGQRGGDRVDLPAVLRGAVVHRPEVGDRGVEVRLVADLQARERAPERPRVGRRLGTIQRGRVGGEVEPEDHPRVDRVRQRPGGGQPPRGQLIAGVGGRAGDPRRGQPRLVSRVAADPQHRRLPGAEVAHERLKDGVDRVRVGAGVGPDRVELDREAEEAARDRAPGAAEGERGARRGGRRPTGGRAPATAGREHRDRNGSGGAQRDARRPGDPHRRRRQSAARRIDSTSAIACSASRNQTTCSPSRDAASQLTWRSSTNTVSPAGRPSASSVSS
jgi:hypothetical protein